MKSNVVIAEKPLIIRDFILDFIALAFIYFAPSLSHLVNLPVYMIEPMRLMVVISLVHSGRINSYILALTLPLFSFLVSGHPAAGKMLIITAELAANVFLYYYLAGKLKNSFFAMISSVILSKIMAYGLYLLFFSLAFVQSEAQFSFLVIQVLMTLIFGLYAGLIVKTTK